MINIINWFNTAKPNPTDKNALQQIAYHFEEVSEMMDALHLDGMASQARHIKQNFLGISESDEFTQICSQNIDKLALLDALCDQIVTALGVGYMMGFDMAGALDEVNRSNWSKFENGKPIIDDNGKIIKGLNYQAPNLKPFLGEK